MYVSNYAKAAILNRILGAAESGFEAPDNFYFALLLTQPDDTGAGATEPSGGAYARVAVVNNTTNFPTVTAGSAKANATAISWPTPSTAWGTIKAFGVYDASSGGNLLYWVNIADLTIVIGDAPVIQVGQFTANFS